MLIENHERMVQVRLYPEKILARSWYYGGGLKWSIPDGLRLIVWDG